MHVIAGNRMSRNGQPDLFNAQPDMFGAPPPQSYVPTLEKVRAEVTKVLDQARSATVMPWPSNRSHIGSLSFRK